MKKTLIILVILMLTITFLACPGPIPDAIQVGNLDDIVYVGDEEPLTITVTGTTITAVNIYLGKGELDPEEIESNVAVVEGDNTYNWTVPTKAISAEYYIRVVDAATEGQEEEIDDDTKEFVIVDPTKTTVKVTQTWTPPDHNDNTTYGIYWMETGSMTLTDNGDGTYTIEQGDLWSGTDQGGVSPTVDHIKLNEPYYYVITPTPTVNSDMFIISDDDFGDDQIGYWQIMMGSFFNHDFTQVGLYTVNVVTGADSFYDFEITPPSN